MVPVVEPLISLKDRKQITASLSFGLQKLVQRQVGFTLNVSKRYIICICTVC